MIELAKSIEYELYKLRDDTRAALAGFPEKHQLISEPYTINSDVVIFIAQRMPHGLITSIWHFNGKRMGFNAMRIKLRKSGAL